MILFSIVKCRLLLVSSDMISRFGFGSFFTAGLLLPDTYDTYYWNKVYAIFNTLCAFVCGCIGYLGLV